VLAERAGLGSLLRRLPLWRGLVVLGYHRVGDPDATELDRGVFSATDAEFGAQLDVLASSFNVIGLRDVEPALEGRSGRAVLLTFDDGYRDQAATAAPMLAERGLPGVFFLTTGFLDGGGLSWWDEIAWIARRSSAAEIPSDGHWLPEAVPLAGDREAAIRTLLDRYRVLPGEDGPAFVEHLASVAGTGRAEAVGSPWMSWDDARALRPMGHDVGAHTVTHPVLARLDLAGQRREIAGSLERLRQELGQPVTSFAYPSGNLGSFDDHTSAILRECGVRRAFSFRGGWQRPGRGQPYDLRRVGVFMDHPTPLVAATVSAPFLLARETR
jgi:peptidoglycan/xylan/chitin deacetylase (PgdA/CDA1 family)